ncbi:MAG TPA: PP2C family protein-serine/threonine phosphatase [Planctomycetota bacterium]|nr:PP2C family protein-serine/threonine phosphatase [Planctomycetota bacterium]
MRRVTRVSESRARRTGRLAFAAATAVSLYTAAAFGAFLYAGLGAAEGCVAAAAVGVGIAWLAGRVVQRGETQARRIRVAEAQLEAAKERAEVPLPSPVPPLIPFEDRELRASREIQSALLPRAVPFLHGYHLEVEYQPCGALSGDFYDFHVYEDGRLLLTLGDVSGKGPAGAMVMAMVQTLSRENAPAAAGPADLLRRVNDGFAGTLGKGVFVTALAALLDPETHRLTLAGAGHHPLLLLNPVERRSTQVAAKGLALGLVGGEAFARSLTETTIDVAPGDSLLLYTDGASESVENAIESRFLAAAAGAVLAGPHGALQRLREDLWEGTGTRADDATLLLISRLGGARAERMMPDRIPRDASV